jgi:hypothetical protein
LRIFFITHRTIENNTYHTVISLFNSTNLDRQLITQIRLNASQASINDSDRTGDYVLKSLDFSNLSLNASLLENLTLEMVLYDSSSGLKSSAPIPIRVGYFKSSQKSGSIVCSSAYFYFFNNMDHLSSYFFRQFEWWFELNKRVGHKKVVIFNTSIPNRADYNQLFARYKDFVEIRELKYFPNFYYPNKKAYQDDRHEYLTSFRLFGVEWYAMFQSLVLNECYYANKHAYKYIAAIDQDEIILPRVNKKLATRNDNFRLVSRLDLTNVGGKKDLRKMLDLESSCASSSRHQDMDIYLERLKLVSLKCFSLRINHFNFLFKINLKRERVLLQ